MFLRDKTAILIAVFLLLFLKKLSDGRWLYISEEVSLSTVGKTYRLSAGIFSTAIHSSFRWISFESK